MEAGIFLNIFACLWNYFNPIGLSCPASVWGLCLAVLFGFVVFSCHLLEVCSSGKRNGGGVGLGEKEGEETGKNGVQGNCDCHVLHEEKQIFNKERKEG